jgi:uncharacterized protein affecting Mg2+/Co2+ transport
MPSTTRTRTNDMAEHDTAPAVARQGSLSARAVGESQYLPDWSEPRSGFWTSGYKMEIVNATTRAVWIERRHWEIHPKGGKPEKTDGAGIGGKVRLIRPGETFRYWSATPLSGPDGGWMKGRFSGRFDERKGEPVTTPVERFELARAEGKPIERDHDKDAAAQQKRELNLKLAAYIKKTKAGDAALDAADLPVAWQWEFTRFCIVGGKFNRHKESGVRADVLKSAFHILVASDADLIHTDRAIYTENGGFENLHLILTYCKPAQDWQLGGPVNESIQKLLETLDVPRHAWEKVSAEIAYVVKVAVETDGKASAIRPAYLKLASELAGSDLEKRREQERQKKANFRQKQRLLRAGSPSPP